MKEYTIYVCEHCNKHYLTRGDALTCEASHIGNGLTYEEYKYYNQIKSFLELDARRELSSIDNHVKEEVERIKREFYSFKVKHGIIDVELF